MRGFTRKEGRPCPKYLARGAELMVGTVRVFLERRPRRRRRWGRGAEYGEKITVARQALVRSLLTALVAVRTPL